MLRFKRLKIKNELGEFELDGYYLAGSVDDYIITRTDENNQEYKKYNPNRCSSFSKNAFTNTINNREDAIYTFVNTNIGIPNKKYVACSKDVVYFEFE